MHSVRGKRRTLVDVGEDTALRDGDVTQKLVQLLIVPDGELKVAGDNTGLLVVASGVAGQLENLGRQVLENRCEVDGRAGTNALGVVALPQETVDTANGEGETGLGRTAALMVRTRPHGGCQTGNLRLRALRAAGLATRLAASGHFDRGLMGF